MQHYDYLIAGSGLAGLYAAFRAARYGSVAIITKEIITESNSYYAQGGIAAVTGEEDSAQIHIQDTLEAGRELCDPVAVNILATEGPERIKELIKEGMEFDSVGGVLQLGLEGGHSKRRVLHAGGDITGRKVTEFMVNKILKNNNITRFEYHEALEIIEENGACKGMVAWDIKKEKEIFISANNTILAMGGASAIYQRSTNPSTSVGEGVAIAFKAGCKIQDIEFIQFHPTALCIPGKESYLISEAVRGEGAWLLNSAGERFMEKIHPLAELAPRDIVARGIFSEINSSTDNSSKCSVYLSLKHLDKDKIIRRFPNIHKKCTSLGLDFTDKIPVAPAAHYMIGGVLTDYNGSTGIANLFACGEIASTGIMGANRLASNSLAECLVFGYRAVEEATRHIKNTPTGKITHKFTIKPENQEIHKLYKNKIASLLSRHAGILRDKNGLSHALAAVENSIEELGSKDSANEYYINKTTELCTVAKLIISGALYREESRGGHYRKDFENIREKHPYHTIQQYDKPTRKEYL
jgi:L-aspartate oxidase